MGLEEGLRWAGEHGVEAIFISSDRQIRLSAPCRGRARERDTAGSAAVCDSLPEQIAFGAAGSPGRRRFAPCRRMTKATQQVGQSASGSASS